MLTNETMQFTTSPPLGDDLANASDWEASRMWCLANVKPADTWWQGLKSQTPS